MRGLWRLVAAVSGGVIDGSEVANDALLDEWPFPIWFGAPVWHLHESFERLDRLANNPIRASASAARASSLRSGRHVGGDGAKPERVCHWAFELVGAEPDDELIDMFPGTGAVTRAWRTWRRQLELAEILNG